MPSTTTTATDTLTAVSGTPTRSGLAPVRGASDSLATFAERVTTAAGLFIAGGSAGGGVAQALVSSSDGVNWFGLSTPLDNGTVHGIAYANGLWVVTGLDVNFHGVIITSGDGVTWTKRYSTTGSGNISGVTWTGTKWVAVGHDGSLPNHLVWTSPDGITWTEQSSPQDGTQSLFTVAANSSIIVAAGITPTVIMTSPDGVTWTNRPSPFDGGNVNGVIWVGKLGLFLAFGQHSGGNGSLMTSPDGVTWTVRSNPLDTGGASGYGDGAGWNGSLLVGGGSNPAGTKTTITSTDGINWTEQSTPMDNASNATFFSTAAWGDNQWVAVGGGNGGFSPYIITSKDGVTWTGHASLLDGDVGYNFVAFGQGVTPPSTPVTQIIENVSTFRYRFYDLMTRLYYGDLPLSGVSFGKRLNVAGSFNATLVLGDPEITNLHPLVATQPSRTLVIIDRPDLLDVNGRPTILWGGILWTRQYARSQRSLTLGGNEAWSYFAHRVQAQDYTTQWSSTPADACVIAKTIITDTIAVPYSALSDLTVTIDYQVPIATANYVEVSYPIQQVAVVDQLVSNLAGMGYGSGFDFTIDWAYDAEGVPRPTMTIWYPRSGSIYNAATSKLLDTTPAYDYTYPEDGSTQANKVYVTGSSASGGSFNSAVDDPTSLGAGYPLLEEVANFPQVNTGDQLSALASGELATHTQTPISPVVDVDPFGQFAAGSFALGDDIRWVVPNQVAIPPVADERFPGGDAGSF